ncbi:MAG TPA: triose-phosphate isomerase [Candidatus Deferrimicrobium sp.]|nr:triose-phosphate isomerase [Candidatus Deferrimicrobium sp.]
MRQKVIAGNWKMNRTIAGTETLLKQLLSVSFDSQRAAVVVCPPFTSLYVASKLLAGSHIKLGAQDMSPFPSGAYTGDISTELLLTTGVSYVILGHSERRQYHGETDLLVNAKVRAAVTAGLTPIVCVGETIEQRQAGQTEETVGCQLDGVLGQLTPEQVARVVVAYEPVWAIGTGKTASPETAQVMHAFIRRKVGKIDSAIARSMTILYGGSVQPANAGGLFAQPDIDGALVGGASLKAADFVAIVNAI